jgi:hypothetical protein
MYLCVLVMMDDEPSVCMLAHASISTSERVAEST